MLCCELGLIDSFRRVHTEWADSRRYQALSTSGMLPDSGRHPNKSPLWVCQPAVPHTERPLGTLARLYSSNTEEAHSFSLCRLPSGASICKDMAGCGKKKRWAHVCVCEHACLHTWKKNLFFFFNRLHNHPADLSYLGQRCQEESFDSTKGTVVTPIQLSCR